jgi:hypothetical protein
MQQRTTAEVMRLRGSTVEHPFATIKYRIFGHPRFLLRGLAGAQTEISLATLVYNLKRMLNVLGGSQLRDALAAWASIALDGHISKRNILEESISCHDFSCLLS